MHNIYPHIGVSIVNYLSSVETIRYIRSFLLKQSEVDLTIAVVDNLSPDESYSLLAEELGGYPNVHVILNDSNAGYSGGNNAGIRFLESKGCGYILVSNSDIEINDEFYLRKLLDEYKKQSDIAFASPVMLSKGKVRKELNAWKLPSKAKEIFDSTYLLKFLGRWYLNKFYYKADIGNKNSLKVDCLPGSFMFGSSAVFKMLNYFDENVFLYYEETIIGLKVRIKNLHNYLIQGLSYNHISGTSIDKALNPIEKYDQLFKSKTYYWKQYINAGKWFLFILKLLHFFQKIELLMIKSIKSFHPGRIWR